MAPLNNKGAIAAAAISVAVISYFFCSNARSRFPFRKPLSLKRARGNGLVAAIGNTPLIRINSLSEATGCEILGKAEFLNPGGSIKDRVAVQIIEEANHSSFSL